MDIVLLILRVLLAILLYAFLAAILVMVWRDLRQATISRESIRRSGQLIVLQTTDEAIEAGTAFPLQLVTSIGRLSSNTVTISDTYASSRHALLSWKEGQWWLEDQGSRNGTLLNETRIVDPTVVSAGDVIGIGRTKLRLELE
ncbi:MAG: FHA domain-containing protein [Anaerolineae bacterium]|jgi:pSer/pThr/pTyr-binding forkhead associated (FHA) protein|nr:FHA domain-containing protein [Anaerolineae bacterium]